MTDHVKLEAAARALMQEDGVGNDTGQAFWDALDDLRAALEAEPEQACICNVGHTQGSACPVHGPHPAVEPDEGPPHSTAHGRLR